MADTEAHWYVAHTYSGYENKVKMDIEKTIENRNLQDQIFDVLVPYECKKTEAQIKSEIQQKLAEKQDTYYTVITFDKGYC